MVIKRFNRLGGLKGWLRGWYGLQACYTVGPVYLLMRQSPGLLKFNFHITLAVDEWEDSFLWSYTHKTIQTNLKQPRHLIREGDDAPSGDCEWGVAKDPHYRPLFSPVVCCLNRNTHSFTTTVAEFLYAGTGSPSGTPAGRLWSGRFKVKEVLGAFTIRLFSSLICSVSPCSYRCLHLYNVYSY